MSTLLDSSFQYIPSNKTDVQATWAKFGWVAPTKQAQPEKIIDRPVQFIVHLFELAHQHDLVAAAGEGLADGGRVQALALQLLPKQAHRAIEVYIDVPHQHSRRRTYYNKR